MGTAPIKSLHSYFSEGTVSPSWQTLEQTNHGRQRGWGACNRDSNTADHTGETPKHSEIQWQYREASHTWAWDSNTENYYTWCDSVDNYCIVLISCLIKTLQITHVKIHGAYQGQWRGFLLPNQLLCVESYSHIEEHRHFIMFNIISIIHIASGEWDLWPVHCSTPVWRHHHQVTVRDSPSHCSWLLLLYFCVFCRCFPIVIDLYSRFELAACKGGNWSRKWLRTLLFPLPELFRNCPQTSGEARVLI